MCITNQWTSLSSMKNIGLKSSVVRQKGESQNGGSKKAKHTKFSEKPMFLTPEHVRVRIRGYEMFVFLKIWRAVPCYLRFEIRSFALLPTKWVKSSCCTFAFEFKLVCFLYVMDIHWRNFCSRFIGILIIGFIFRNLAWEVFICRSKRFAKRLSLKRKFFQGVQ